MYDEVSFAFAGLLNHQVNSDNLGSYSSATPEVHHRESDLTPTGEFVKNAGIAMVVGGSIGALVYPPLIGVAQAGETIMIAGYSMKITGELSDGHYKEAAIDLAAVGIGQVAKLGTDKLINAAGGGNARNVLEPTSNVITESTIVGAEKVIHEKQSDKH
jgi:hypothetical protein